MKCIEIRCIYYIHITLQTILLNIYLSNGNLSEKILGSNWNDNTNLKFLTQTLLSTHWCTQEF